MVYRSTEPDLETFRQFTGRTTPPTDPAKEAWVIVGRRGGKSLFAAALAVYAATFRDYQPILKPGQGAYVQVMAADSDQAMEVMGYITGFLDEVPALSGLVERRGKQPVRRDVWLTLSLCLCAVAPLKPDRKSCDRLPCVVLMRQGCGRQSVMLA